MSADGSLSARIRAAVARATRHGGELSPAEVCLRNIARATNNAQRLSMAQAHVAVHCLRMVKEPSQEGTTP